MTFNSVQDTADDSDNYQLNGLSYRQCQREWSSFVFDPSWCSFSEWSHLVPRTVRRTVFEKLIPALLKRIEGHSHQCYDRRLTRPKMVARTQISAPNLERNFIFHRFFFFFLFHFSLSVTEMCVSEFLTSLQVTKEIDLITKILLLFFQYM